MPVKKIKFRSILSGSSFFLDIEINESVMVVFDRIAKDPELCTKLTNKPDDLEFIRNNGLDPDTSKFSIYSIDGSRIPLNNLNSPIIDQIPPSIKQLDTFELVYAVKGIVASTNNLQLQAFVRVVSNFFEGRYDCFLEAAPAWPAKNTSPGHNTVVKIRNFPAFSDSGNHKSKGDILLCLPRHTCYEKKNGALAFDTIQQKHINLWYEKPGQGFRHPHVFSCGEPCLNGASVGSLIELFDWFIQTLMLTNVTAKSIEVGKLATNSFGKDDFYKNLESHRNYLKNELGDDVFLRDGLYVIQYFEDCYTMVLDSLR